MRRIKSIHLLVALFVARAFAGQTAPEWLHEITPSGLPHLEIEFAKSANHGPVERLTLQHRLQFNGVRYASRVFAPLLESTLIPKGQGRYEWRNLNGQLLAIKAEPVGASRRVGWRVVENVGPEENAVVGNNQVCVYRRSKLVAVETKAGTFEFKTSEQTVRVTDPRGQVIIQRSPLINNRITVTANGAETILTYNERAQLVAVQGPVCGKWTLDYQQGLLTEISADGRGRFFVWGSPAYKDYEKRELPLSPVVIKTGEAEFSYSASQRSLFGTLTRDGKVAVEWTYSYRTESYRTK